MFRGCIWVPDPPLEALLHYRSWPLQALCVSLLGVLTSVTLDSWWFPLYFIFSLSPRYPALTNSSCLLYSFLPSQHTWSLALLPRLTPSLSILFTFPSGTYESSLSHPSFFASLGRQITAWLSFMWQVISSYKWIHTMFVFPGLHYLTQHDFFLLRFIYLHFHDVIFLTAE